MQEAYEEINIYDLDIATLEPHDPFSRPLEEGALIDKCRACIQHLLDIRHNLLESTELLQLFRRLSTTEIDIDDLLPKSICNQCFLRLKNFESFQQKCISSYSDLLLCSAKTLKEDPFDSDPFPTESIINSDNDNNQTKTQFKFEEANFSENEDEPDIPDCFQDEIKIENEVFDCSQDKTMETLEQIEDSLFSNHEIDPSTSTDHGTNEINRIDFDTTIGGDQTALYKCEKCESSFDSEFHYEAHLRKHEGKKPYPCSLCAREYLYFNTYQKHMKTEHSDQAIESSVDTVPKKELKHHKLKRQKRSHTSIRPHEEDANVQLKKDNPKKKYSCEHCERKFSEEENLIKHTNRMHLGYKCSYCDKSYNNALTLKDHETIHTGEMAHKCPHCDKAYRWKPQLRLHLKAAHKTNADGNDSMDMENDKAETEQNSTEKQDKPRKYQCGQCDKKFFQRAHLQRHTETVHLGLNYTCSHCKKSFTQLQSLNAHLKIHTGERPYKCYYCDKAFILSSPRRLHIKAMHKDKAHLLKDMKPKRDYPKRCDICDRDFTNHYNYLSHVKFVHEKFQPYTCQFCNRKFGKRNLLRNHIMIHTGERPIKCEHCDKRFISRSALRSHMKKREQDIALGKVPCSKKKPKAHTLHQKDMSKANIPVPANSLQVNISPTIRPPVNTLPAIVSQANMPQIQIPAPASSHQLNISPTIGPHVIIPENGLQVNISPTSGPQANFSSTTMIQANMPQGDIPQLNIPIPTNSLQLNIPQGDISQANASQPEGRLIVAYNPDRTIKKAWYMRMV